MDKNDKLTQLITSYSATVAQNFALENGNRTIESTEASQNRIQSELEHILDEFEERLSKGLDTLFSVSQQLVEMDPQKYSEEIFTELEKLKTVSVDEVLNVGEEDKRPSLQSLFHITDTGIEYFYTVAEYLYEEKRYEEAADVLYFIIILNPIANSAYWLALGNAQFFNQQYEDALNAYAMSVYVEPENMQAYLFISHCYTEIGQYDGALHALEDAQLVLEEANMKDEWLAIIEEGKAYINYKMSV